MRGIIRTAFFIIIVCWSLMLSDSANAQNHEGTCGAEVYWSYSKGTLTIHGKGDMTSNPWMKQTDCRKGIRKVVIEEGVTSVCKSAFSAAEIISDYQYMKDGIELPDSLREIGENAFSFVDGIKNVDIPASVQRIGKGAFSCCGQLERVSFSDKGSLTTLEEYTFSQCEQLETVILPDTVTCMKRGVFDNCRKVKDFVLPDGLQKLGNGAFRGCESVETITVPEGVLQIPANCFSGCIHLLKIRLAEGTTDIGAHAFAYCRQLKEFMFPPKVVRIGNGSFSYCASVRQFILPDTIAEVGTNAFESCAGLKKIRLSSSMKELPEKIFLDCTSLERIDIPDTVKIIRKNAFQNCASLKGLYIPKSITKIEPCHQDCPKLKVIQNKSRVSYPLSASRLVMNWYQGNRKVSEVKPGRKVTSKGKRFTISYDKKNLRRYKIQIKGKLPVSYVYGKEPKLPSNIFSSKNGICFMGWWYRSDEKRYQTGVTRTWYNARISQFSRGLKGDITIHPMVDKIVVKKNHAGSISLTASVELKDYLAADCIDVGKKGDFGSRYLFLQIRYAYNEKMRHAVYLPMIIDDSVNRIYLKNLKKGASCYIQYRSIPLSYGGVPFETRWGQKYKIRVK